MYLYVSAGRCPTARAGILSESEIEKCSRPMRYENDYIICHALYYMLNSLLDSLPLKIDVWALYVCLSLSLLCLRAGLRPRQFSEN